jgi:hypothetical protein
MKAALRIATALIVALVITSSAPIHALSGKIPPLVAVSARRGEQSLPRGSSSLADPATLPREFLHARGTLLLLMASVPVEVELSGTSSDVLATSGAGEASDTDFDGREQVAATFVALNLHGTSSVGNVLVRLRSASLSPNQATLGEIEEQVNATSDTLDLPPFTSAGAADGTYAAYLEIEIAGTIYHNEFPMNLAGIFNHTPPLPGQAYQSQNSVQLYDEVGEGTRNQIDSFTYIPVSWLVMLPLVLRN